jgi:hypothetical protein
MKKWFVNNIYNFLINYPYNIINSTVCKIGVEALAVDDLGLIAALVHKDFKSTTFNFFCP